MKDSEVIVGLLIGGLFFLGVCVGVAIASDCEKDNKKKPPHTPLNSTGEQK